jgi:uncharacterized protein
VKFQATAFARQNAFTGYGEGYVTVNGERHTRSLIVLVDRILPWPVASVDALAAAHFDELLALRPEVVLLGTGARLRFPHAAVTAALPAAGIGLEVMDVQAACRTYNILVSEERVVAAALVLG